MEQRVRETLRYLGYGKHSVDESTLHLISESFEKLDTMKRERFVYRFFEVEQVEENILQIDSIQIKSKDLSKNLTGCTRCAIFVATLGVEIDTYIRKCTMLDMAKTVILQACAATLMEELCDHIEDTIREEVRKEYMQKERIQRERIQREDIQKENMRLKPRFSAGYGDLNIAYQEQILAIVEAQKKIGVTLTDSFMMVPTKSVTAFVGIQ